MVLSGVTVRTDQVELLTRMLEGDDLAAKLLRGLENHNDLVALTPADRQRIVTVLDGSAPSGLAELRDVLVKQLKSAREREAQAERSRQTQRLRDSQERREP
jgi:hypothetical protein